MAKLIILGSSAIFPFPRTLSKKFSDYFDAASYQKHFPLHDCAICLNAAAGGKDRRTRASLAILSQGKTILIDAGPDVRYQLDKYQLKPSAVFITHHHADADYGLRFLRNVKVYSEERKTLKPGGKINIAGLTILPFRVEHAQNIGTVGFLISAPSTAGATYVAYLSDLASLKGVRPYLVKADLIFVDGSRLETSMPGHLSMLEQLKSYKKWKIRKVLFTHIGHSTLPHLELSEWAKNHYERAGVAYDGLTINL